jgi:hypothetical protein
MTAPHAFTFSAKLFSKFLLRNAQTIFEQEEPNVNIKMAAGFLNFSYCLSSYISQLEVDISKDEIDESEVTIYGSVTLENGAIMRASNSYHGNPWFSNVSVRMNSDELFEYVSDQGICYGQVIV